MCLNMAFMLSNFIFLDNHRCPSMDAHVHVLCTWLSNGELRKTTQTVSKPLLGTLKRPFLCPVRAVARIQKWAEHLQHPLGLLGVSSTGPIAKCDAIKHLRACVTRVYGYTAKKYLDVYTLHSIRVRACVLLYEMGKSATFIKDRLRWKFDSFMGYLRDTPRIATQHAACLW